MSKDLPTAEDITAAHNYAVSLLCTEIPDKYGEPGITMWDSHDKMCKITKKGCQAAPNNPISQPKFDPDGKIIKYDKYHPIFGEFWKKNPPGYYVWRTTENSPRKEVCARGNFLMQQWCESPKTRADKDVPGVTDAVPFKYEIINGKEVCEIPKEYCDSKGVSYDAEKKDCYVKQSQKVAEFFSSSVFVRENKASDKRLKKNIIRVRENFPLDGVHLYVYEWNDIAYTVYGYSGVDIGFLADELDAKYIKVDKLGYKLINTGIQDETMNKIYAFLKIKDEIKNIYLQ